MSGIADFQPDTLDLKVMQVEYTDNNGLTVAHVFGRDADGDRHHVEVVGHEPNFYIRADEYDTRVDNHYAVVDTEKHDGSGNRYRTVHGEPLVKVYVETPSQVGDMRDLFEQTWEADVLYPKRWLIDNEVLTGIRVDDSDVDTSSYVRGEFRAHIDDVEPLSRDETPGVEPRKMVVDIEVASESGYPSVDNANWPVSTIVAWDSYDEAYVGWLLEHDDHGEVDIDGTELDELRTFDDESDMLADFHSFVEGQSPDIITSWYGNDFDVPYLFNRSRDLNTYGYKDWSPLGEAFVSKYDPVVKGRECVDMLEAYKKTQIHNLKDKSLDAIAEKEGVGSKEDVVEGHTEMWKNEPTKFLKYNKVDAELVHRIDESRGCIELLDNLRAVVGCFYSDIIGGNIDMMDVLFLRKAQERTLALPTAEKPDKSWYYGAKVFDPKAGLSKNVIYLDVSSLYPAIIKQLNVSPEMIRSDEPEGEHSKSYIDTRPDSAKKGSEPEMEPIYYDSSNQGFVASLVNGLVEMKNDYRGTGMYAAVKRITNSIYGVLSDGDSYGVGFRLFDWRMGESICLAGRKIVTSCSELALKWCEENGYEDAYIKMGDTDGFGVCLPSAEGEEESLCAGFQMEKYVNENIAEEVAEMFEIAESESEIEIECESYASHVFVKGEDEGRSGVGVRKKHVQRVRWEK